MKYIIMCGGRYEKWEKPKQLCEYKGEPIVMRTIRLLRENGVQDIAISSNNDIFKGAGVPLLKHNNPFCVRGYNDSDGYWCDCFYPTDEPACYLMGDVVFSRAAIRKIVEYQGDGIMLFGSKPPFARNYVKKWIEPFAFKVWDTDRLKKACIEVKRLDKEGKFNRVPIAWELWSVICGYDLNKTDYRSYVAINDFTCDIDDPEDLCLR